jgi:hypothetical protein
MDNPSRETGNIVREKKTKKTTSQHVLDITISKQT